ncbi:unnamed protein product [Meloidogyne enterolobii]|uniref:Uncharacterized protein n=1 Tax=Meloidogyne enterolobii TaxID=390850 RepID=A0ACB1AWC3_MELEN
MVKSHSLMIPRLSKQETTTILKITQGLMGPVMLKSRTEALCSTTRGKTERT